MRITKLVIHSEQGDDFALAAWAAQQLITTSGFKNSGVVGANGKTFYVYRDPRSKFGTITVKCNPGNKRYRDPDYQRDYRVKNLEAVRLRSREAMRKRRATVEGYTQREREQQTSYRRLLAASNSELA